MKSHSALGQTNRSLESQALAVMGGVGPLIPDAGGEWAEKAWEGSGKRMEQQTKTKSKIPTPPRCSPST